MPNPPSLPPRNDEVDVPRLARPLRRHALPLLSAALLAGAVTYAVTARQPRQYETMSSLVTLGGNADGALGEGLIAAPPVPPGTLQQALRDGEVVDDLARRVLASDLPPAQAQRLAQRVEGQRQANAFSLVTVSTPEGARSDLYEVWGRAADPASARVLVNASVDALIAWDERRTRERVELARASLQKQLTALNRNEPPLNASDVRWETFESTQAQLLRALTRVSLLGQSAVGTLDVVARAPQPTAPVPANPLSRAVLAALLALFGASAAILLLEAWRRRVYDAHSLRDLGVPLLGQLPAQGGDRGALAALGTGPLGDSLGFLRVNVLSQLPADGPRRVVFSSPADAAATGSVVAALGASLAASGQRVLLVDVQPGGTLGSGLWSGEGHLPLPGEPVPAGGAQRVAERLDLLALPGADPALLGTRAAGYDVTLIAAPPLLRRSDALLWAGHAAGIVLILDPGTSSAGEVERVLGSADLAKVRVLGAVLSELRLGGGAGPAAGQPRAASGPLRAGEAEAAR